MTRYTVNLTKKALKHLRELDEPIRNRILEALVTLQDYGFTGRLDIKKLRGYRNHYRIRIGEYRVLFELEKPNTITVYAIILRKKAYKK
ncbi:MAG: type II toxin-antitoxin system RelE/ParE family toxin [Desulfurococcales archaeon]|nr:type II toxin-antitoxin system RelE/ParE family toxin [Desulfurococcales archaeon]